MPNSATQTPPASQSNAKINASQRIPVVQIATPSAKIHVREQKGVFQRLRQHSNTLLIALFFLLPFINYQGRQAILFDVTEQQFFFFNLTLWPQDFTVLAWFFMAAAFALFFVTVYWGRVWCGFLCPQTAWTFIYMWIEANIEGNHHHRAALDKAPWSISKLRKRLTKHALWIVFALLTGCGFISYFMPARELYMDIFTASSGFWTGAWVWFFAICTYLNAGWMREMMCLHCCPYSRFQAVMFDANTKTVSYDAARGESRGPRKRAQKTELGDCVDCNLCVDVCPTGIDIRNGLQYECINCGACVDACNQTMEKFGYAPNLISFTSENALKSQPQASVFSLKGLGYASALLIMISLIIIDLSQLSHIQLNVIRDRQTLYREVGVDRVENSYQLKIRNKTQQAAVYQIAVRSNKTPSLTIVTDTVVQINPGEQLDYPVTVSGRRSERVDDTSQQTLQFSVTQINSVANSTPVEPENQVTQQSRFFWP
ncbi:cytochrome c oxidase accessory protein CcoG [Shewanella algicola]|uniref:Cytochrome c oxidase accessory protein CcoG n=1 Tax=Shewanella algicola TaxID=640633 RepID=A0A9X1Z4D5_9GAMM|nr:cytochrome c oxidase accessory protein CcoG [Shewanella algicola]MCL1104689.1 cytochrome c oxidase accessory protein CcoG [Shewanella algicola]GGP54728.1 cytochrome c oxidase accessory protein CcoG [Shewanella algicola]